VVLPRSTTWFTCQPQDSRTDLCSSREITHSSSSSSSMSYSFHSAAAGSSQATTADHTSWVPVLQLWKSWAFRQGLPPAEIEQLTTHSSACGESTKGPVERPSTAIWPRQLHHRGGDTHGGGSTCGFVLSQRMPHHYVV
jgi:hypothetical protein